MFFSILKAECMKYKTDFMTLLKISSIPGKLIVTENMQSTGLWNKNSNSTVIWRIIILVSSCYTIGSGFSNSMWAADDAIWLWRSWSILLQSISNISNDIIFIEILLHSIESKQTRNEKICKKLVKPVIENILYTHTFGMQVPCSLIILVSALC